MLSTDTTTGASPAVDSLFRRVAALGSWNATRHRRGTVLNEAARSREDQLHAGRRLRVLRHAHKAVLERTAQCVTSTRAPLSSSVSPRVVVAHRQEWSIEKLTGAPSGSGVAVVGVTAHDAEALGMTVRSSLSSVPPETH
jgi:hypothetical protein